MTPTSLSRAAVEAVVGQALRQAAHDPDRSLRRLVDLGSTLTRGRAQQRSLALFQDMLSREGSPYYGMVRSRIEQVNPKTLQTFGVNLGWESWTAGAKRIRALEGGRGHSIPWCLTLRLGAAPNPLTPAQYSALLAQGQALGISTYFFFSLAPGADPGLVLALARQQPHCALLLFLRPEALAPALLGQLAGQHNLMVVLLGDGGGWQGPMDSLLRAGCLTGLCRTYATSAQVQVALSDGGTAGTALFLLPTQDCPDDVRAETASQVLALRTSGECPLFPVDCTADLLRVGQIISREPCLLWVSPDGALSGGRTGREDSLDASLHTAPLEDLLARCFPLGPQAEAKRDRP